MKISLSKSVWNKTCWVTMTFGKSDIGIANPLTHYHIEKCLLRFLSIFIHQYIFIKWGYNNFIFMLQVFCWLSWAPRYFCPTIVVNSFLCFNDILLKVIRNHWRQPTSYDSTRHNQRIVINPVFTVKVVKVLNTISK